MKITGFSSSGKRWESRQMAYCAEGCERLFLSKQTCVDLGILEQDFPKIGRFDGTDDCSIVEIEEIESLERSVSAELASAELYQAITHDRVRTETGRDPLLMKLMDRIIKTGGTGSKSSIETWDEELVDYKSVKDDLQVQDGVLFNKHRFVIPEALRSEVLNVLHSAHLG